MLLFFCFCFFEKQNVHQVIGIIKKVEEIIHFRVECWDSKNSYHHYHLWPYYLFLFVPRVYMTSNRGSFFFFFLVWKRFDSGRFAVCVLCGWRIPICGFRSITVWNRRRSCQNGDVCDAQRTMIIREWEGTTLVSLVGFCRGLRRCTINSIKGETIGTTTRESKRGKKKG